MKFDTEWNPSSWTLDNSIPLRIYSKSGEYIAEIPCNMKELESLHLAVQEAFFNLFKWNKKKSKHFIMTDEYKQRLEEYRKSEKEQLNAQKSTTPKKVGQAPYDRIGVGKCKNRVSSPS